MTDESLKNFEDCILTKEKAAKFFIQSLRELPQRNLKSDDDIIVSTLYDSFKDKVKAVQMNIQNHVKKSSVISFDALRNVLDTGEIERDGCELASQVLELYLLGDSDEIAPYIDEPFAFEEVANISIWLNILSQELTIMNPEWISKCHHYFAEAAKVYLENASDNIEELNDKLKEVKSRLKGKEGPNATAIQNKIDKILDDVMKSRGVSDEALKEISDGRNKFRETHNKSDGIENLNKVTQSIFGKNLITPELWDKVEEKFLKGEWGMDEKSINEIIEEIRKNAQKE